MVVCWQENVVNCQWDNNKHQFMVLYMEFCTYQEEHRNFFFFCIYQNHTRFYNWFFLCLIVIYIWTRTPETWVFMFEHFCVSPLGKHLCRSRWGITKEELWCSARVLHSFSTLQIQNFLDTNPKISWIKSRNKISVNRLMWRNKHWFGRQ